MDLRDQKKIIRSRHHLLRERMSKEDIKDLSSKICQRIADLLESLPKLPLACYAPTEKEVDISLLFRLGRICYFPKVDPKTFKMEFYQVNDSAEMKPGPFNILEPTNTKKILAYNEPAIFIMPSLAISRSGVRLGYGGGFYDRYLEKHTLNIRIAPIFSANLEIEIPEESFDKPIHSIVTESETLVLKNIGEFLT